MSTLLEIEEAIDSLPPGEQRELYRRLNARLVGEASLGITDKRKAVAHFLKRWRGGGSEISMKDESSARESRLMEKHAK